jgi:hypothetical protein
MTICLPPNIFSHPILAKSTWSKMEEVLRTGRGISELGRFYRQVYQDQEKSGNERTGEPGLKRAEFGDIHESTEEDFSEGVM